MRPILYWDDTIKQDERKNSSGRMPACRDKFVKTRFRRGDLAIAKLFGKAPAADPARDLYDEIVRQARLPGFYQAGGVPDTVDGRFELVALHVFLVLHRLKTEGTGDAGDLGQALFDIFVQDMDASLREMGAGDLGVGKRVKAMIRGLYGRIGAYESALGGGPDSLEQALQRNLFGTVSPSSRDVERMAGYVRGEVAALGQRPAAELAAGQLRFGSVPA